MSDLVPKEYKPNVRSQIGSGYRFVNGVVYIYNLNSFCEEANCPNIYECWSRGTATIMILGDVCTRACGFCAVKTGKPTWNETLEPFRTAMAVKKMKLRHVVITSVDRDDIKNDYGTAIWSKSIREIHKHVPDCTVEVLTPDFKGDKCEICPDGLVLILNEDGTSSNDCLSENNKGIILQCSIKLIQNKKCIILCFKTFVYLLIFYQRRLIVSFLYLLKFERLHQL